MSGGSSAPLLEVRELCVAFDHDDRSVQAVDGLSYQLAAGQTLSIIGESGSGKTAGCRALMGLLPASARVTGSVRLDGKELIGLSEPQFRQHRGSDLAMVFQDATRSLNPTMRVGTQITEAIRNRTRLDRHAARLYAIELLEQLRVPAPQQRFLAYPHELSGGMRQRVMLAIAIACKPRVLIADEATRSLDVITQAETMRLLKDLQQRLGMALIMVSHDLRLAAEFADDLLVMYAGRVVEYASTRELFRRPRMRYTCALLNAVPRAERPPRARFAVVPGQPPDPTALPPGCSFESRCASASAMCKASRPRLDEREPGHWYACWHPSEDGRSA